MDTEAAGGLVLLAATIVALVWANSRWWESYFSFLAAPVSIHIGWLHFDHSLQEVINDGLMAIFFFVVGLEIKRELVVGELSEVRKAALPALAALGGMVVPATLYVSVILIAGSQALEGWAIPMATDIAFSIGILALLGSRISSGAKLFLLALAIVDDIGAIAVIAVFYTADLHLGWLALAAGVLMAIAAMTKAGIRAIPPYVFLAIVVWAAFLESGVHPTIAGVILGLLTPVRPLYSGEELRRHAGTILGRTTKDAERIDHDAAELAAVARESVAPVNRFEHALHPWSSFFVVPLFAFANAGIRFADLDFADTALSPVVIGVAAGLVLGKPIGIGAATWIAVRLGIGRLPARAGPGQLRGIGILAGIGFTVSLLIADLAFGDSPLRDHAKMGILAGSLIAGVAGYIVLRVVPRRRAAPAEDAGG